MLRSSMFGLFHSLWLLEGKCEEMLGNSFCFIKVFRGEKMQRKRATQRNSLAKKTLEEMKSICRGSRFIRSCHVSEREMCECRFIDSFNIAIFSFFA